MTYYIFCSIDSNLYIKFSSILDPIKALSHSSLQSFSESINFLFLWEFFIDHLYSLFGESTVFSLISYRA